LRARPLEEAQIGRVIGHAAGIGILVIDSDAPGEHVLVGVVHVLLTLEAAYFSRSGAHISLAAEQIRRRWPLRGLEAEQAVGLATGDAPSRRALEEALLDQERLDHILERVARFAERGSEALDACGSAVVALDQRLQELAIHQVESVLVDL